MSKSSVHFFLWNALGAVGLVACIGGGSGGGGGGDCRQGGSSCGVGFVCTQNGANWECQPGDGAGAGSNGAPPGASDDTLGAAGPDITSALDELTAGGESLMEGEYETSQGTVSLQVGPCDDPACDFPPGSADGIHYSCDPELPHSYRTCIHSDNTCLYAALAANPYHVCGGYGYPDEVVHRECRELGDYRVECSFPNVIDDRVVYCRDAQCVNLCTSTDCPPATPTQIEFCVEMDRVITPGSNGYCENYYHHEGQEAGREQCPFVAAAPSCAELGIGGGSGGGGGGGAPGRDATINKQCTELIACSGGPFAQCVSDLGDFYDSAPPAMQATLRELVASCAHLTACDYAECSAL